VSQQRANASETRGAETRIEPTYLIASLAKLARRGSRFVAAYFVVVPGRKACPLTPPQHGAARSEFASSDCLARTNDSDR